MYRTATVMVVALAVTAAGWERVAYAVEHLTAEQIKVALRTADAEEEGFIENALILVNRGVLPEELLNSTFLWARKKPRHKFQYFKYGLTLRAADRGIPIGK